MSRETTQAAGPTPIEPPRFRGRKFLFGCAGVAIAVIILVIIGIAVFVAWLRTPGVLMEGGALVDAKTAIYAEAHLRPDDPGIVKFFREAIQQQHDLQKRFAESDPNVPAFMRPILDNLPRREGRQADLEKILPVVVVATRREAGEGGTGPLFFALSLPKIGNRLRVADFLASFFMKWARPGSDLRMERYGDEVLYVAGANGRKFWCTLRGSDVFVSGDEAAMKETLDRLSGPSETPKDGDMSALMARRPGTAAFFVAAREGYGSRAVETLEALVPAFGAALKPLAEDAGALVGWGSLMSTNVVEGELHLMEPSAGGRGEPDGYSGSITAPLKEGDVTLSLREMTPGPGERQAWTVRLEGMAHAARHVLEKIDERERRHRPEAEPDPEDGPDE